MEKEGTIFLEKPIVLEKPVVLWLSRHKPLPIQLDELKRKLGDYELVHWDRQVSTAERAVEIAERYGAKIIVAVLPLSFVQRLIEETKKRGITLLKAEMELLHICDRNPCPIFDPYMDAIEPTRREDGKVIYRHFRFKRFVRRVAIEEIVEPW